MSKSNKRTVNLPIDKQLTITFSCPSRLIPEGIQIIPASGGGAPYDNTDKEFEPIKVDDAQLDTTSLLSRITVDNINVISMPRSDFCSVYVNAIICTPEHRHVGFNFWNGVYENFIRELMTHKYSKLILKKRKNGNYVLFTRKLSQKCWYNKVYFSVS